MGYSTRSNRIRDFWPDDDQKNLFLSGETSLEDVLVLAKDHFGNEVDLSKIVVTPEHTHTSCLRYDLYDPSDYTDFIHLELRD